jgi:hypothetical protein
LTTGAPMTFASQASAASSDFLAVAHAQRWQDVPKRAAAKVLEFL